jgi:exonuclease VII small subunit
MGKVDQYVGDATSAQGYVVALGNLEGYIASLESELASLQSRLAAYEEGYD